MNLYMHQRSGARQVVRDAILSFEKNLRFLMLSVLQLVVSGLLVQPRLVPTAPLRCRGAVLLAADAPCQDEEAIRADATTAFRLLDLNGDGEISDVEFTQYLLQFRYTESAIAKITSALDANGDGNICIDELRDGLAEYCRCESCEPKFVAEVEAEADAMFAVCDLNSDGAISSAELHSHLTNIGYSEVAVDAVFRSLDTDDDGELSLSEMRAGFLSYSRLRQAMTAVVTTLVKKKQWAPSQKPA